MSNFTPEEIQEILNEYFNNTTHRQYIGARYVPIFGRKGETSVQWDNSNFYEPLTIVLYQGNSFTSRQYVPAGVDINNELYWAETGNFNAQVEAYRNEVLALSGTVDDLDERVDDIQEYIDGRFPIVTADIADGAVTNVKMAAESVGTSTIQDEAVTNAKLATDSVTAEKIESQAVTSPKIHENAVTTSKINNGAVTDAKLAADGIKSYVDNQKHVAVYLGNSFALGTGATDGNGGIFDRTKDVFDEAYLFWDDGIGFDEYTGHDSSHTFNQMVENAKASTEFDNNDVTEFIIVSAMGDTRAVCEGSNFVNLAPTISNITTNFPNAQVFIYYAEITGTKTVQSSYSNRYAFAQLRTHLMFEYYAATYSYIYLGWGGWNINFDTYYTSNDNYHPNNYGYITLSKWFIKSYKHRRAFYIPKKGNVQYGNYATVSYQMTDPLHGTCRMGDITATQQSSWNTGAISIAQFWNPTATDKAPCFYPECFNQSFNFMYNKQSAGTASMYSAYEASSTLSTASGNCLLNVTNVVALPSANINVSKYYGTGFTLPINMWVSAELTIS